MTHHTGYLCHVLGRVDTCRIVGIETGESDEYHGAAVEVYNVETPDGLLTVTAGAIVRSWPASDESPKYTPPPIRMGIISPDEAEVQDE